MTCIFQLPMKQKSFSSSWATMVASTLEVAGLDPREIFDKANVNYDCIADSNHHFTPDEMTLVWEIASEVSGNEAIGLLMTKIKLFDSFGALSYSMLASRNLQDALQRLVRYQRLFGDAPIVRQQTEDRGTRIILDSGGHQQPLAHQGFDAVLALLVERGRSLSQGSKSPLEIQFMQDEPAEIGAYQDFFQCPMKFSQSHYSVLISHEDCLLPISTANEMIAQAHDKMINDSLARMVDSVLADDVREMLTRELPGGEPFLERIAAHFSVSSRTLQRRLRKEGCSFQELVDDTRMTLALDYVTRSGLSFQQIAYLLGFTEHSNFDRAFKRWYGRSPSEYRSDLQ